MKLTKKEQENLEAWKKREGWTKEKSFNHLFGYPGTELGGNKMPINLIAPGVKGNWSGEADSKYVCVMCGYVTTATNVCRQCPEMPTTTELTAFRHCDTHDTVHFIEKDGKKIPTTHESIGMVKVR